MGTVLVASHKMLFYVFIVTFEVLFSITNVYSKLL